MAKNTTASLRKALEEGKVIVIATGVQTGEPVEYNPRSNRDRTPWALPGTDIRYGAGELEVREATPREKASRTRKAKREASKPIEKATATEEVKTSQKATNDVLRNLYKDHPDYELTDVWERLSLESLEDFTTTAKAWLADRSELGISTLEKANWQEIYDYLRVMADKKPENERQEAIAAAMEATAQETREAVQKRHAEEASREAQEQPTEEAPTETPEEASPAPIEAPKPPQAGKLKLAQLLDAAKVDYSLRSELHEATGVTVVRYVINGKELSPAEVIANHLTKGQGTLF